MPRKTRKQKILAEAHRRKNPIFSSAANFVKPQNEAMPPPASYQLINEIQINKKVDLKGQTSLYHHDTGLVKRDLRKIALFTFFALTSQIVLYYLLRG